MRTSTTHAVLLAALGLLGATASGQLEKLVDEGVLRTIIARETARLPDIERRWREKLVRSAATDTSFDALFGYDPPGRAVQLAWLNAVLHTRHGRPADAAAAREQLLRMARYGKEVPSHLLARAEYANGLPAVPSFFQLADYAEAWRRVRSTATDDERRELDAAVASSAEFVFTFPEWGAHNRAVLRACCLLESARALPRHPKATRWRRMSDILVDDSLRGWEVEDAQLYHPIWLNALLRWADSAGRADIVGSPRVRYYMRYFLELMAPDGSVPDFGDSWWHSNLAGYFESFSRGARALADPELAWAATRTWDLWKPRPDTGPSLGHALVAARLLEARLPDAPAPRVPRPFSGAVLDGAIGKKLVFRTGRGARDTYLCLNFRDEGSWGLRDRDFLRRTLAVEEEKMHHGHADENAVVLLMDRGAVLLHEAGYRERAPSGPHGAYRADIHHNRLVVRRGTRAEGGDLGDFLRDSGRYRRVRTHLIDHAAFEELQYGRTRLVDADLGYRADRTVVLLEASRRVVVIDTAVVTKPGRYTFAVLWAGGEVEVEGRRALLATPRIEGHVLPKSPRLLLVAGAPRLETFPLRRHRQPETVVAQVREGRFEAGDVVTLSSVLMSVDDGASLEALDESVRFLRGDGATGVECGGLDSWTVAVKDRLDRGLKDGVRPRYDYAADRAVCGPLDTDADFAFVHRGLTRPGRWGATNMTRVYVKAMPVFEAPRANFFQTSGRSDVVSRAKWRRWSGIVGR